MKRYLLIASLLMTTTVARAIEFTSEIKNDPFEIEIVSFDSSGKQAYDSNNTLRLYLDSKNYYLYNSLGIRLAVDRSLNISESDNDALRKYLRFAAKSCPITLEIDRTTFEIKKATAKCDPLAKVESADNEG